MGRTGCMGMLCSDGLKAGGLMNTLHSLKSF
jgi:hypothetical protein